MIRIAEVKSFTRISDEDGEGVDVSADAGDADPVTVPHYSAPGDDSPPLSGDSVALEDCESGSGAELAVGYADTRNPGEAAGGEKRIYGRTPAGAVVNWVWLKGDGSVVVENVGGGLIEMAAGGDVTINGVVIAVDGSLTAPGEVSAMAATPATAVALSTHLHPHPMGPTSAPTPGT